MRDVTLRRPVGLALAGLGMALLVGCGHPATTLPDQAATSSETASPLTGQAMPGAELAARWDSPTSYPCAQPGPLFGDALRPLADSMKDLPSVDSVKARLITVTARGAYISEDLGNLHAALLQTRYDMVSLADHHGVDASQVRDARNYFNDYLSAVVSDLQSGSAPTPMSEYEFRMEDTCA